jgi:hypothetical protein
MEMKTFAKLSGALAISSALLTNAAMPQELEAVALKPGYIADDAKLGFFVRTLRQADLNDGSLVLERSINDSAIMLRCEWRVVAKREQPESEPLALSQPEKAHTECRSMEKRSSPLIGQILAPEKTERLDEGRAIIFKHPIYQEIGKPDIIYETHESINSDNVVTFVRRAWHVASKKVCLFTSEGVRNDQETRVHFQHDWGCHSAKNELHFKYVQQAMGISPPL